MRRFFLWVFPFWLWDTQAHMLIAAMGGACAGVAISERKAAIQYEKTRLFADVEGGERYLDETLMLMLPADVQVTASAGGCTIAFEDDRRRLYGIQFELERNDPDSSTILKNFARDICGCSPWFTIDAALAQARQKLSDASIEGGYAVCGVSGGVDRLSRLFCASGIWRAHDGDLCGNRLDARGRKRLRAGNV